MTKILGIDPGNTTAYALLEGDKVTAIGTVSMLPATGKKGKKTSPALRLHTYMNQIMRIFAAYRPDKISIEEPYIKHRESAKSMDMKLAILLVVAEAVGIKEVSLFNPNAVKITMGGHGNAEKEHLARACKTRISNPELLDNLIQDKRFDETDAVAIAILGALEHTPEIQVYFEELAGKRAKAKELRKKEREAKKLALMGVTK